MLSGVLSASVGLYYYAEKKTEVIVDGGALQRSSPGSVNSAYEAYLCQLQEMSILNYRNCT